MGYYAGIGIVTGMPAFRHTLSTCIRNETDKGMDEKYRSLPFSSEKNESPKGKGEHPS